MSIGSLTDQQSVFSAITPTNISQEFLPTRWRQKSTGMDMKQNYVIVTLCIPVVERQK